MTTLVRARPDALAAAALTVAGAAIRFATLDRQSFWFDELVTVRLVRRSFGGMLSTIPHSEATPYLYYVLAWPWARVFGAGEVGLRSLSALAGTATVPVVYAAGATLCSRAVGLVAAALVSVEPFLVWYSQEARSYALLTFFAALGFLFFARALRGGRADVAGWAVASALALATHYFAVFLVAPEAAWLILRGRERRSATVASLVPLAVFAAHVPLMLEQRSSGASSARSALSSRASGVPKDLTVGYRFPLELAGSVVASVLLAVGFVLIARTRGRQRQGALVAGGLALVATAVPYLLAVGGADYLAARNLVAVVVPAAVCVAAGFATSRPAVIAGAGLCIVFLAITLAVSFDAAYGRTDWRGAAHALGSSNTQRAIVVIPAINARLWRIYLPGLQELQSDEAAVREIDAVGVATQGGFSTGAVKPPPPRVETPPAGFRHAGIRRTATYTIVRYRASRTIRVSRDDLLRFGLTDIPSGILLQR
jgi:4-amino-4-deoxy-L-arabinose transferase-like glycosyltransferase